MSREDLQSAVAEAVTAAFNSSGDAVITFEEGGQFLNGCIDSKMLLPLMKELRTRTNLDFDYLFCLTCVDYKTHFTMFYHMRSLTHRHEIVIKAKIEDIEHPAIDSVSGIWLTADFTSGKYLIFSE